MLLQQALHPPLGADFLFSASLVAKRAVVARFDFEGAGTMEQADMHVFVQPADVERFARALEALARKMREEVSDAQL